VSPTMASAELAARFLRAETELESWFKEQASQLVLPPYSSADIRDASFKVCPVDLNLFPAGYNNLHPHYFAAAVDAWRELLVARYPEAHLVCIIPESHTRNRFYLQNVTTLSRLLKEAGYEAVVATVDPRFVNPVTELEAADGSPLTLHRAQRADDALLVGGARPDIILLNNDLADGVPAELAGLAQPLLPPTEVGWHARHKSRHFAHYGRLADRWAAIAGVDPWLINPLTECVEHVDFHEPDTFGPLADSVERITEAARAKYAELNIDAVPHCFIKDDAGTYGMGIITVRSGEDVRALNRKQRNKMDRGKGNVLISRVIVQEGVPTTLAVDGALAEAVMYAVGDRVIGGFRRYHTSRGAEDNLNAKGAQFTDLCGAGEAERCLEQHPLIRLYGGLTRISILAAAHEIQDAVALSS